MPCGMRDSGRGYIQFPIGCRLQWAAERVFQLSPKRVNPTRETPSRRKETASSPGQRRILLHTASLSFNSAIPLSGDCSHNGKLRVVPSCGQRNSGVALRRKQPVPGRGNYPDWLGSPTGGGPGAGFVLDPGGRVRLADVYGGPKGDHTGPGVAMLLYGIALLYRYTRTTTGSGA